LETGLSKVFADEESYNSGHGQAYERYGINPYKGALVIVRPDHYVAKVAALDEVGSIQQFFEDFMVPSCT